MGKAKDKKHEYVISLKEPGVYSVAKFGTLEGGEQPLAVYTVKFDPPRQMGKCDCHAAMYRGMGPTDKHVGMVRDWLEGGKPLSILR